MKGFFSLGALWFAVLNLAGVPGAAALHVRTAAPVATTHAGAKQAEVLLMTADHKLAKRMRNAHQEVEADIARMVGVPAGRVHVRPERAHLLRKAPHATSLLARSSVRSRLGDDDDEDGSNEDWAAEHGDEDSSDEGADEQDFGASEEASGSGDTDQEDSSSDEEASGSGDTDEEDSSSEEEDAGASATDDSEHDDAEQELADGLENQESLLQVKKKVLKAAVRSAHAMLRRSADEPQLVYSDADQQAGEGAAEASASDDESEDRPWEQEASEEEVSQEEQSEEEDHPWEQEASEDEVSQEEQSEEEDHPWEQEASEDEVSQEEQSEEEDHPWEQEASEDEVSHEEQSEEEDHPWEESEDTGAPVVMGGDEEAGTDDGAGEASGDDSQ